MLKIIIPLLFATFLSAQSEQNSSVETNTTVINPYVYSALGDVVYNNVSNIEKLKLIPSYAHSIKLIDLYVKEVNETREIGHGIQLRNNSKEQDDYLEKLRTLAKTNDMFQRNVLNSFELSIKNKDNELFRQTVNSGLLDTDKYKDEILEYHFANCNDKNATGVIKDYLEEDKKLKAIQDTSKAKQKKQEEKIKRIRAKDKERQESIQKQLELELFEKKDSIRKEQEESMQKATENI